MAHPIGEWVLVGLYGLCALFAIYHASRLLFAHFKRKHRYPISVVLTIHIGVVMFSISCVCVCAFVCVCEREKEREREIIHLVLMCNVHELVLDLMISIFLSPLAVRLIRFCLYDFETISQASCKCVIFDCWVRWWHETLISYSKKKRTCELENVWMLFSCDVLVYIYIYIMVCVRECVCTIQ